VTRMRRRWCMSGGGGRLSKRHDGQGSARHGVGAESVQPQELPGRRWIWYRSQPGGHRLALEEFEALDVDGRAGLAKAMQRYRDGETRRHDVDSIGEGIFELRYRHHTERFRLLFMLWGPYLVVLTAFQKKQTKTPKPDLDRARTRAKHWREVFGTRPADEAS
jgi:phage-related protein